MFVAGLAKGDLGKSLLTERPVNDDIRDTRSRRPSNWCSSPSPLPLSSACRSASPRRGGRTSGPTMWCAGRHLSAVTPSFFLALLLQILAGYVLHILPTTGRLPPNMAFSPDITGLMTVDSLLKGRSMCSVRRSVTCSCRPLHWPRRPWARLPVSPAHR
jgi:peptide/nickel transport system permease protein